MTVPVSTTLSEPALERGGGIAVWRQIEEQLRGEITSGGLAPAQQLPTEQALARRFAVNRHTVRRALAALAQRGLIRVEQGRGSFVQEEVFDYALGRRTRFSENIARQRREPGGRLLQVSEIAAGETAARALDLAPGTPLLALDTLREADGLPLSTGRHCFPAARFVGIAEAYAQSGSLTQALARCGIADYTRKWTRLTARLPTALEASQLRQPQAIPVLQSEAVNIDAAGQAIEYGVAAFAGTRVHFLVEG